MQRNGKRIDLRPARHRTRGLSLIEVLLVVGIIGVLMAVTFPSLRAARTTGRINSEQNAARQLAAAYIAYTNVNRDAVMPGYLPECTSSKPQFCFSAYNAQGESVSKTAARRYPWRIAPFLSFQIEGLFVNEHRGLYDQMQIGKKWDYEYAVSMAPSLGLNTEWLGGDASHMSMGFINTPVAGQPPHPFTKIYNFNRFYITRITQTLHPERLIVFASARGPDPLVPEAPGHGMGVAAPVEGHFRVTSPMLAEGQPQRWEDSFHPGLMPAKYGFLSPRYRKSAVVSFIDGGTGMLSSNDLRDMRHWANWADSWDWALPKAKP